jgi:adenylate cyclase
MKIVYCYKNVLEQEKIFADEIIVGRNEGGVEVDLDLQFDRRVSHRHARVWVSEGRCWIEDLGSRNGTTVNGQSINGKGRWALNENDVIKIADTTLRTKISAELPKSEPNSNITLTLDARAPIYSIEQASHELAERRLAILYELPLQFGGEEQLDALLTMIVRKLVELVPGSTRVALTLEDPETKRLLLKAHVPPGEPAVSMTLAQRALEHRVGFVWQRDLDPNVTRLESMAQSAMYAPLLWKGNALGVITVDNYQKVHVFGDDDLKLLMAVAQQAAMAVANQMLQEELRREAVTRSNLLQQFSPKIAHQILSQRGRLQLGGERCEATILFADIRGFSKLAKRMEPEAVVELLNYYFAGLLPVIFSYDGTIDKYAGDAVLSIFGSPEPDVEQYEKAIRAAVAMQAKMRELTSKRDTSGEVGCNIGIGVHCGEVVHGFIGMPDRMSFAVIGDPVNRAARYCDAAKASEVLISPELYERVWRIIKHAEPLTIDGKFQEQFSAYRITELWE